MQEYKGNLRGDEGGVTFKVYVFKSDLLILLKEHFLKNILHKKKISNK